MKTPDNSKPLPSAPRSLNFTERQRRGVAALLRGPVMREALDRIAGCSNGPALIAELRGMGLDVPCERVHATDRDGKPCKPGRYSLSEEDRDRLRAWWPA